MSVEKQGGEKTPVASTQQQKPSAAEVHEESTHSVSSSISMSTATSRLDGDEKKIEPANLETQMSSKNELRGWFESLSDGDRICALTFSDGAFLATLLALAPWSPAATPRTEGGHVVREIDWEAMVTLKHIEKTYGGLAKDFGTDKTSGKDVKKGGKDSKKKQANGPKAGDLKDGEKVLAKQVDSDAFRIRFSSVQSLLDHLTVSFPGVLKNASGGAPYVTVDPRYLEMSDNGEELLLALDTMAHRVFRAPFLSKEDLIAHSSEDVSTRWLGRLAGGIGASSKVPLYALLLAKLECSVHETHSCVLSTEPSKPAAEVGQYSFNDEIASLAETHSGELVECMEPYISACFPQGIRRPASLKSTHLLNTPLNWVLPAGVKNYAVHFDALNGALLASIKSLSERGPSNENQRKNNEPNSVSSNTESAALEQEESDASHTVTLEGASHSVIHKKKKRRNRRRRQQKTTNADSVGSNGKESTVSDTAAVPTERIHQSSSSVTKGTIGERESPGKIVSPRSLDSEDTELSSVRSEASASEERASAQSTSAHSGITISRVEGVLVVATPVSESVQAIEAQTERASSETHIEDDGDAWETVETRVRGSRKKNSSRDLHHSSSFRSNKGSAVDPQGSGSKKNKGARASGTRKKNTSRKIVRDILSSVIDTVDEEARKRSQSSRRPAGNPGNPWKRAPSFTDPSSPARRTAAEVVSGQPAKKEATLRDVVLGRHTSIEKKTEVAGPPTSPSNSRRSVPHVTEKSRAQETRNESSSPNKSLTSKRPKGRTSTAADQNTAPTYQETVSAVSTSSNLVVTTKGSPTSAEERTSKGDSSTSGTGEALQHREAIASTAEGAKDSASAFSPPLPTLLSAENANSADSSVASSLEVPHTSRRTLRSNSTVDVNDVGYHLLDVCDRLSRDMGLFMNRRAMALNARRRERGALLAALQDAIVSIWPGRGHVEMYGSCATQLDLPSSDLDVVVVGLDRNMEVMVNAPASSQILSRSKSGSSESLAKSRSIDEAASDDKEQTEAQAHHIPIAHYAPMQLHINGERVIRLAAELEGKPWAVQVNAIPTASVPVVKVLADPSKLVGASTGGDWMVHRQHLAAQAAAAAGQAQSLSEDTMVTGLPTPHQQQFHPPWRGADVMNGLLSLDITFEGPEHGGIGSTHFSARVVAEACQEAGSHPDATALVQVLMVLKELLAQRKLNEPYSGGLSSYALLLLVVALMRERAVIREEIERAERQRKAMTVLEDSGFSGASQDVKKDSTKSGDAKQPSKESHRRKGQSPKVDNKSDKGPLKPADQTARQIPAASSPAAVPAASSWASIAKSKSSSSGKEMAKTRSPSDLAKGSQPQKKPPTFADAVARSAPVPSTAKTANRPSGINTQNASVAGKKSDSGKRKSGAQTQSAMSTDAKKTTDEVASQSNTAETSGGESKVPNSTSMSLDTSLVAEPSLYPQGYDDIIEVLCSGETTAGKLLMHFLLYYGQHFDAQTTAIDISGKHERDPTRQASPYSYFSPYIQRRAPGSIDPVTGMLTVDPIVIFDPLEGAENNNVARRCFAWSSVRWIFAQSYATLSSAVERSATPPATPGGKANSALSVDSREAEISGSCSNNPDDVAGDLMDPSSPLLRCLLSF